MTTATPLPATIRSPEHVTRSHRDPTILTAEFSHESNTFSVRKTGIAAFVERGYFVGEDAVRARGDANTALAGFATSARRRAGE